MFMQNIIKLSERFMSYRANKLFAVSRNGKESEKSGPVTLTLDLGP